MNSVISRSIIVIAGPTCSGKSNIAIKLAKEIDGVIINGDSRQIYKELSIGTAKPTKKDMDNIDHYLYGHVSVKEHYDIYKYKKEVDSVLATLPKEKIPIIVGGTGLYIDSVVFNYKLSDVDKRNDKEVEDLDIDTLQNSIPKDILEKLNNSDRNNPMRLHRILRKGEISQEKGIPLNHIYFVIDIPKEELREKIAKRVNSMLSNGLIEENRELREKGLEKYSALRSIGYQEFNDYFEGKKNIENVKEEIINHTNQYAKRQRTWFRRNKNAIWTNDYGLVLATSLRFISTL